MKTKISKGAASIASAALAATILAGATQPASAQQPPRNGWYKVCAKQEENDICNVQFQSVANTGQLLTAISLLEITEGMDTAEGANDGLC